MMKKKLALFFVFATTLYLTACGGNNTQTPLVEKENDTFRYVENEDGSITILKLLDKNLLAI